MEARPEIKLNLSKFDKALELTSKIFLVSIWCLTFYIFLKLPRTVPIHFGSAGKADNYGDKIALLILPIFATLFYFGLTEINKYPHVFNYAIKITAENAKRQYIIATRLLRFLKVAILTIFSLIVLFTYLTSVGATNGLGSWFLPLSEGLLLIPIAVAIIKMVKQSKVVS